MRPAFALLLAVSLGACSENASPQRITASLSVGELMSEPADPRFARALGPREFAFPRDHGPHPEFQTEWWYFTGNLADERGREFGYELTFFRRALLAEPIESNSAWTARDVYMAHFAISDVDGERFLFTERNSRASLGLAGSNQDPLRVWLRDWTFTGDLAVGATAHLSAASDDLSLELDLAARAEPVLQGERGLSRKGREPGNASYYYSVPRLETRGRLAIDGREFEVTGLSWCDREWSTSALEHGQVGWDWFALQLEDGRDLMLFHMRRDDGSIDATSAGSLRAADGTVTQLASSDFAIEVLDRWTSRASGAEYPSHWRVSVPSHHIDLEIEPVLRDQELRLSVRYWEGAVHAVCGGRPCGRGYVELVGY